jgi:outer membrane protein insertion porin family
MLNGEIGMGDGFGGKPMPFYKNFYAGGVNSVRGFQPNSIGPKDANGFPIGGTRRIIGNGEVLFPFPGLAHDKSVRLSAFVDGGMIGEVFDRDAVRVAGGLGALWVSPLGPLKISFAQPINDKTGDRIQRVQFTFGSAF